MGLGRLRSSRSQEFILSSLSVRAVLWRWRRTFFWSRSRLKSSGFRLLLCDLRVLWWQRCDNFDTFSKINFFTQIIFKKLGKLLKKQHYYYCTYFNCIFYLNFYKKMFLSGAGCMNRSRVKIGPAPQHCVRGNNNFQTTLDIAPTEPVDAYLAEPSLRRCR